ncbi:Tat (Twin-arginine translocation) pathway signal sequence domain protein [Marinobacterium lacunae]|uniref:Tat (Twin-arginine translocation) pathway signal sequence domain protein n=1 Tax=Marinobacterium lacunae TaxID=1232683 RepID=A0A081G4D9_9GAMM|nr:twin-arginine translocation signal domain-containing protein [Marinobacterium lacunae]KEA65644.1 Tat (Twin-arginine translocation) pathway signal sequence domain protein [Marinobacterium lacunae]
MKPNKRHTQAPDLNRRRFLARSSTAVVGLGMLSSGLLTPSAWAAQAVGEHASATLLRMARDIYPHDTLEDKYYAAVLTPLADKANSDADLKKLLTDGVRKLDSRCDKLFARTYLELENEPDRVLVLRAIEDGAFFQRIKGDLMMGIYNNPELWPRFGYGGSAWEKGGYINRGYDKIDWL